MELVLIRGLPGGGKTTMARTLALVGYEHHEADQYFERDGAYMFDPARLRDAHEWCLDRTRDSIERGVNCVVANTFTQQWEMQPYLDAAKAAGVPVRVIEAHGKWENCHGVPAATIEKMRARWETIEL